MPCYRILHNQPLTHQAREYSMDSRTFEFQDGREIGEAKSLVVIGGNLAQDIGCALDTLSSRRLAANGLERTGSVIVSLEHG
ncbi:hypothetical protein D3C80_2153060 [compost metagenome]